nr:hypothetical protein GCM10020092_079720 [Actinoplanes digitatis]
MTPAQADLGDVATGSPETTAFTVIAPAEHGLRQLRPDRLRHLQHGIRLHHHGRRHHDHPGAAAAGWEWLSDRPYVQQANGWGPVEKDRSNGEQGATDGRTLTIAGVTYARGLGVHAVSNVLVELGGDCTRFRSDVGVDDEASGSVGFEVWVDGVRKAQSTILTGVGGAERMDVDLTGGRADGAAGHRRRERCRQRPR